MAPKNAPTVTVELSTDPWNDLTPSWTNITAYFRGLDSVRGRNNQLERTGPGRASIVLDNRDRRFEPGFGTISGLAPMNRIRITATYNAVPYDLFYGYVDGWPQDYHPSNKDATVTVPVTDLFGYLANVDIPDAVSLIAQQNDVTHRYLFDDTGDAIRDSVGGVDGAVYGEGVERGSKPLSIYNTGSIYFDGTDGQVQIPSDLIQTKSTYTISFLFQPAVSDTDFHVLVNHATGTIAEGLFLTLDVGQFQWEIGTDGSFSDSGDIDFTVRPYLGVHHVMFIRSDDVIDVWLDGVHAVDSFATGQGTAVNANSAKMNIGNSAGGSEFTGWIGDLLILDAALSDTEAADLAEAYMTGFDAEDAATRWDRILQSAGYLDTTSFEAGEPRCGPTTMDGNALSLAQVVDATEQGRFFIDTDGVPTSHNRSHNIVATRSTVTQCTFSDDSTALASTGATDVPIFAGGFRFDYDKTQTINEVSVSSPALASEVVVDDDTAKASYGTQSRTIATIARSSRDAESVGDYLILKYKDPQLRSDSWTVTPQRKPVTWPTLLGLTFGDRVVLERTPQRTGGQKQIPMYLERIEHHITPEEWTMKFAGVPSKPESDTTYWALGSGALGSTTRLYV